MKLKVYIMRKLLNGVFLQNASILSNIAKSAIVIHNIKMLLNEFSLIDSTRAKYFVKLKKSNKMFFFIYSALMNVQGRIEYRITLNKYNKNIQLKLQDGFCIVFIYICTREYTPIMVFD